MAVSRRKQISGRSNPFGYLFIAPALILYLVFNIWTIIRGFLMAFTDYRFIYPDTRWDFNGFNNYREMISDPDFWQSLGVTIRYSLMVLPATILLALLLALVIGKVRRGMGFYRWMVYLPVVLPVAVTFLMFGEMYNFRLGFINSVLQDWGVESPPNWLGDVNYVLPSLAVGDVWRSFGFPTLLFLIGIYNIDSELYDAAAIDGATALQRLWYITLPLLNPIIALVLVLNLAVVPATTDPMLILTEGGPQEASRTLGLYLYQIAFLFGDLRLGYAAAMNLILGLATALASLIIFRRLREAA
jgi:multiple sugar transport system permease protein